MSSKTWIYIAHTVFKKPLMQNVFGWSGLGIDKRSCSSEAGPTGVEKKRSTRGRSFIGR